MASKGLIASRLQVIGTTIDEITELLYGHPGNQSYYTILYRTKKSIGLDVVERLLDAHFDNDMIALLIAR